MDVKKQTNGNCGNCVFNVNFGSFLRRRKTMKKMSVMLMVGLVMSCVGTSFAAWAYQWNCNEFPENFQNGTVFQYAEDHPATRSISNGIYTVETNTGSTKNYPWQKTKPEVWDSDVANTIEMRMKIDSSTGPVGAVRFLIAEDASDGGPSNEYMVWFSDNRILAGNPWGTNDAYNMDTTVWTTYQLKYYPADKLEVYIPATGGGWQLIATTQGDSYSYGSEFFRMGQDTGNVAGIYEQDYIYWTPEPATIGLMLLGLVGFIRRR